MNTNPLEALALETHATIPPDVDAISALEMDIHFHILFIVKLQLFKYSKVGSFKLMFEFNQALPHRITTSVGKINMVGDLVKICS